MSKDKDLDKALDILEDTVNWLKKEVKDTIKEVANLDSKDLKGKQNLDKRLQSLIVKAKAELRIALKLQGEID